MQMIVCVNCGQRVEGHAEQVEFLKTSHPRIGEFRVPFRILYRVDCPTCGQRRQSVELDSDAKFTAASSRNG